MVSASIGGPSPPGVAGQFLISSRPSRTVVAFRTVLVQYNAPLGAGEEDRGKSACDSASDTEDILFVSLRNWFLADCHLHVAAACAEVAPSAICRA